jgi:hypothetical protein
MDLVFTRFCVGLSIAIGLIGLFGVRFPPTPGHWRGWVPSHYILLTGLTGLMCFGLHWLSFYRQP